MKRTLFYVMIAAAVCIVGRPPIFRSCAQEPASAASVSPYLPVHKDMVSSRLRNLSASGITQVDDDTFLLCSYSMISRLQRDDKGWALTALEDPAVPRWNPTGTFYDAEKKLLYVANYKGKDVLVLEYEPGKLTLPVRKRITHEKMVGPENVSAGGDEIWVADYDGNAVFKFDHDGKMLAKVDCPQAHGILVTKDFVYATSLADREVLKIRHSGEVAGRHGKLGVEPGQYAWPVALEETHEGNIAVLDAHLGRVTILSPDLVPLSAMGSNGPGVDLLNYPYGITRTRDGYALADTLKSRIVFMDKNWNIRRQIHETERISLTRSVAFAGSAKEPYTYPLLPGVDLLEAIGARPARASASKLRFTGGYNSIDALGPDGRVRQELEIDNPALPSLVGKSFWYMTWASMQKTSSGERFLVIGSPQVPTMLVVEPTSGAFLITKGGVDLWPVKGKLVDSDGREFDWEKKLAPAREKFGKLKELLSSGVSRSEAFRLAIFPDEAKEAFDARYWQVLLSGTPSQRAFWAAYKKGDKDAAEHIATQCYLEADAARTVYFQSILAVRYLSGTPLACSPLPSGAMELSSSNPFYEKHELTTALDNDDPARYAAAVENQESYGLSISFDKPRAVWAIVMRWHEDAIPTSLSVSFIGDGGKVLKTQAIDKNEDALTCVLPELEEPVSRIEVVVNSFKGQQRLLLRRISVYSREPATPATSQPASKIAA